MSELEDRAWRAGLAPEVRLGMLERDVSKIEESIEGLREELRGISRILMGLLVAVATGSIMVAINILIQAR